MQEKLRRLRILRDRVTDRLRWTQQYSYQPRWIKRSAFAAALCADSQIVCDIGCGMQELRKLLHPGIVYLPADLKLWTEDTRHCDLNLKNLPDIYLERADTVTMLGVIEYIYDVPWVLEELFKYVDKLIVSYNPSDISQANRANNGWVNSFTLGELVQLVHAAGFIVRDIRLIEEGQVIIAAAAPV